jgi:hypothetical protein
MKYILILILCVLASCKTPTEKIATSATTVETLAQSSKERFQKIDEIVKTKDMDVRSVQSETQAGVVEQEEIISLTKSTLVDLTKVEDKVPWWVGLINYIMITLSILAVCFLLWYTGIGSLIKSLCYSFGLFIPKVKLEQASIARKTLEEGDPTTAREMVAALRASDPAFDAAYSKLKEKKS